MTTPTEHDGDRSPDHGFEQILTPRLRLRRFTLDDLDAFVAYRSDPEVARYQSWGADYSRADGERFLEWATTADPDTPDEWFQFAIERLDEPGIIGDCAAMFGTEVEIGFTLATEHHGHGYATEAAGVLLDYARRRGHRRAVGWCDIANAPSARVLVRLGFEMVEEDGHEHRYARDL